MSEINITLNGEKKAINANQTLEAFLLGLNLEQGRKGLAACVNLEGVSAQDWSKTFLKESDRLEILIAAPGG